MNEPWLKSNVRPLIALVAFVTLSIKLLIEPTEPLLNKYIIWTGAFLTFYFGLRFFKK